MSSQQPRDLLSSKKKAATEQSWFRSMLSAVADTHEMRDGVHTLEAKQSKEEEMLHIQHINSQCKLGK